ncbi:MULTISPECIES: PulJ/GspJ family protein [Candidatus Ichthyocystis]|uniref:PulJ/GspJ family protein n=1 Tax=Candidatus Ichthyocystis TaxID=2929841 RepID=UPI000B84B22C|nr:MULTISPECIES: type II secretion system protein GspJ [Ichthyocystis]
MKLDEGLTLIELLVSLIIVSILSVIVTRSLSSFIRVKEQTDVAMNSFDRLSKVFLVIDQDVTQIVPVAPVGKRLVDNQFYAFPVGVKSDTTWLVFLKMSPDNLGRLVPPEIVSYRIINGKLARLHRHSYESEDKTKTDVLLDGVTSIHAEYFDSEHKKWCGQWPCADYKRYFTPTAFSLSLSTVDGYEVHQVFLLPR